MPLYEYTCRDCGKTFEKLVASRERDAGLMCADCGSKRVRRLVSTFAIGRAGAGGNTATSCPTCTTGTCDLGS